MRGENRGGGQDPESAEVKNNDEQLHEFTQFLEKEFAVNKYGEGVKSKDNITIKDIAQVMLTILNTYKKLNREDKDPYSGLYQTFLRVFGNFILKEDGSPYLLQEGDVTLYNKIMVKYCELTGEDVNRYGVVGG